MQPNGIIVIDKPTGMSSARVAASVKRLLNVRKVGHAGTLDPFASGVLVCCLNRATKLVRFLLQATKGYHAVLKLGASTDTQDVTGKLTGGADVDVSNRQLRSAFERFRGPIDQQPPVFSALKHRGKPLYQLARSGRPVQKPPRRVHVHELEICSVDLPFVAFRLRCSAGTYVRTICHDIGELLGCGAHLYSLRRTECSGFDLKQAVCLDELEEQTGSAGGSDHIISMADALPHMPEWTADADTAVKIRHGQPLTARDVPAAAQDKRSGQTGGYIKVVDRKRELISILRGSSGSHRLEYCCVFSN